MRVLAAFVLILAAVLVGLSALGEFGPTASPHVTAPGSTPSPASSAASPAATAARTIALTFTEQDLTKAAQGYMPLTVGGITVTDPRVRLDRGRLTLTATGRAFILSGSVVVVALPLVTNGAARAQIESATFAGIGLPDSTKQDVADTFSRVLAANIPAGVRVTSVTVSAGSLVVQAAP